MGTIKKKKEINWEKETKKAEKLKNTRENERKSRKILQHLKSVTSFPATPPNTIKFCKIIV